MIKGNRLAVPGVGEHDSLVGGDQVQIHRLVESVPGGDDQVAGRALRLDIGQYLLQANASPPGGADQRGPNPSGDTRESDVLVPGLIIMPNVVEGQHQGIIYQTGDGQRPGCDVDIGRFRTEKHLVMVLHLGVLGTGARCGNQRITGIGKGVPDGHFGFVHRPGDGLVHLPPFVLGQKGAQAAAEYCDGGGGRPQPDEKLPAIDYRD